MHFERYIREPTKRTPWVVLEPGKIIMMGRSIPDDPLEFYGPVLSLVSDYIRNYQGVTELELGFEYINTSSTKWIYIILKEFSAMGSVVTKIHITWYFEEGDEDMNELGQILRALIDCPFEIVEVEEMNPSWFEKSVAPVS